MAMRGVAAGSLAELAGLPSLRIVRCVTNGMEPPLTPPATGS